MGKFLDFLGKLSESKLEITDTPVVVNNYYITINNRVIKLNREEFERYIKQKESVIPINENTTQNLIRKL